MLPGKEGPGGIGYSASFMVMMLAFFVWVTKNIKRITQHLNIRMPDNKNVNLDNARATANPTMIPL